MSREYAQQPQVVCDLFGRDSGGYPTTYNNAKADKGKMTDKKPDNRQQSTVSDGQGSKMKPQFSEDLWEHALKRHCDSRQNLRSLLDRYIKPHH